MLHGRVPASADAGTAVVISAIEGMGGVGKTGLALHMAHQLLADGRYGDVQLYVDLRGHADQPPADPTAVLGSFLRLLGVPGDQIPQDIAARAALYRDRLYGKNALVLLDNAASEAQVTPLVPAGPGNLVLVTSRRALAVDGARTLVLDVFSQHDAEALLAQAIGAGRLAAEPEAVRQVVELCGHLPLAVALVARRLRARPRWRFADLVARLARAGDRLGELGAGSGKLRAVFDLSYHALDEGTRGVFGLLGMVAGDDFAAGSVAALAGIAPRRAQRVLEDLVDEHLVTVTSGDRYRLHDLLHDYARAVVTEQYSASERSDAVTRLLDYYLYGTARAADQLQPHRWTSELVGHPPEQSPAFTSREAALRWLNDERVCLVSAVRLATGHDQPVRAWQIAHELRVFLGLQGLTDDWVQTHETALGAAVGSSDQLGEAVMRTYLGAAYLHVGRTSEAEAQLQHALRLHGASANHALEMIALNWLDFVCYRSGRFREALRYNERGIALCTGDMPYQEGILRNNRGDLLTILGRYEEALDNFRLAAQRSRRARNPDNVSIVLANMGLTYAKLGRFDEALDHGNRALQLAIEHDLPPKEAAARMHLGIAYRQMGRFEEAVASLREALRLVRSVSGTSTESEVLIELGATHREAGDLEAARETLREAWQMAAEHRETFHEARALNELAHADDRAGEVKLAREHWAKALELFERMETPEADQVRARIAKLWSD